MLLKDAQVGHTYVVEQISLPFQLERRLEALGMTRETPVSVLNRKGKGILIIKLRGTRFALGYNITKNITVKEGDTHGRE
ncbi:FeoA family protein [uncultured Oscillibacter sp.]|uniref:FeoA family protein n=1 Tax=uncultured Oscillibacter sp. TaxID=876091 RepID=UPI002805951F|nr:FeoA family protein [uncultured Oscillibacter sp.]